MRTTRRLCTVLLAAIFTVTAGTLCALAAETRTPIKEISLHIESTIESGSSSGDVYATAGSGEYRVGDVEILNDDNDWVGGMRPRVEISLYANSGYYFYSSSKSMFSFSGEDVTYVTSRRDSDKTELTVTIKLDKLDNGDLSVSGLEWDESTGTAMWDENPNAKYYQVKLFREGSSVTSTRTTYEDYYEFAGSITRRGDYYFEVRAVGSGSEKGDWESSDTWYVSSYEADDLSYNYSPSGGGPGDPGGSSSNSGSYYGSYAPGGPGDTGYSAGGPAGNSQGGYWCLDQYGWWYRNADGSYTRNKWQVINGSYYFFNESGYMRTGWIPWNNKWYYCGPDGALWANARTPDGYYVGGDGVWIP